MRCSLLVLALLYATCRTSSAGSPRYTGVPIVQVFSEQELPGSPHTRRVAVSPAGLVYAANVQGLIEYDGVSWRLIPGTEGLIVHAVAVDPGGRIWYAGKGQFGMLVADGKGVLRAETWQGKLPKENQAVGHVMGLTLNGREVYFVPQGEQSFLAHVDGKDELHMIAAPENERFANVFVQAGKTYAITTKATYLIDGETLREAPEAKALTKAGVLSMWPRTEGGAWVVSTTGLRIWKDGEAPLVSNEVSNLLKGGRVLCGAPLGGGNFALGTEQYGLLLVDATGHIYAHYDEDSGLGPTSNRIEAMAADGDGGLWLALYAGITRIQIETPAALHDLSVGVRGRIECFTYYQGRLHVGTTQGVFARDSETGKFSRMPDAGVDAWALIPTPEGLIIAGNDLRLIRPDGALEVLESERLLFRSALLLPHDPSRLVASTGPGQLRIYHRENGRWQLEGLVPDVHEVLFDLRQDDEGWLWAAYDNRRTVARLDWRRGVNPGAKLEVFGPDQGLPVYPQQRRNVGVFLIDGKVEVSSVNGLWQFDGAARRFVPEARIIGFDASKWSRVFPLADGSLWLASAGNNSSAAIARRTGRDQWRVKNLPFVGQESREPRVIFDDPAIKTVWLGFQGLASYDMEWSGPLPQAPLARLRSIQTDDGEILWGGAGPLFSGALPSAKNSLKFDYAAAMFQDNAWTKETPNFRTQLVGYDDAWSAWSESAQRDYSQLPPGRYTFQAQARDNAGSEGLVAAFTFTILPPWWRTWWACSLYAAAAVLAMVGFVQARTRALRARASKLEGEVAMRTRQLAQQNGELVRLHRLELDEKIAARLAEEKARLELLRYQLNPHFLFNTLTSISAAIPRGGDAARKMVQRLSEFCRLTLHRSGNRDWATLGEELRLLRTYLEIEKSRWGDLLQVEIECARELEAARLPQFLLLPLVENALKYGRATSPDRVEVRLGVRAEEGQLVFTVANTGEWLDPKANSHVSSLGIGLDNLRERLARYYPGQSELSFAATGGWVTVTLTLVTETEPALATP